MQVTYVWEEGGAEKRDVQASPFLCAERNRCYAACVDGKVLELLEVELDGQLLSAQEFAERIGNRKILLPLTKEPR